jgi:hypothetical protein
MADDRAAHLGDQRQREVAVGAQCIDDRRLGAFAVRMVGEGDFGDPADRRLVAGALLADRPRRRHSRWPARSRLVAR